MKSGLIFLILLLGIPSAQRVSAPTGPAGLHGTFIASFIGKNGIVTAADSRTVMYGHNRVMMYFEETSKIFQFHSYLIAVAGQYTFGTVTLRRLLEGMGAADSLSNINLYSLHDSLLHYAKARLTLMDYYFLANNQFLVSGYSAHKPVILYYNGFSRPEEIHRGYATNLRSNALHALPAGIGALDVEALTPVAINLVQHVEDAENKKDPWSIIGGPVSAACITDSGVTWIKDQNRNNFESLDDFYEACRKGKIQAIYRSKGDSIEIARRPL